MIVPVRAAVSDVAREWIDRSCARPATIFERAARMSPVMSVEERAAAFAALYRRVPRARGAR